MTEHDERMWNLLTSSPTTSCEKWAAARILELESGLRSVLAESEARTADVLAIKAGVAAASERIRELEAELALRAEIEISIDRDKQRIARAQCDGMQMAVRLLDSHGHREAATLVQAALDGAFI